ncbi:MAG: CRISPR-associated protein Cas4 [Nanoarchaeota archaeon]|nr:CRISPR-associated protein Cas4 [Nanoarchaeota archaeon]
MPPTPLPPQTRLTGTQIQYFIVCPTKLWLFSHKISMEHTSDIVKMGKAIHETSYSRENKEKVIDSRIAIDFVKRGDALILHEVKKSRRLEKAHRFQLLYYLYYLKRAKGIIAEGVIDYPAERHKTEVTLSEEAENEIESTIQKINAIIQQQEPPKAEKKRYCRKCSYFQLCWA